MGRTLTAVRRWEWLLVCALTLGALALYSFDLDSYRYSFQGEYLFYQAARDICRGVDRGNPFSEGGVEGLHPKLDTCYQAAVMKLVGVNIFGLKFSSVLAAAAAILPLYVFIRLSVSRVAAIAGTACYCFSYYSIVWAHTAWNNNHVIFPFIASLCLFVLAARRDSFTLFFLCGLSTGLGFYTYYPARLTLIMVGLLFLQRRVTARAPTGRFFLCFIIAFALAVSPLVLATGPVRLLEDAASKSTAHPEWGEGSPLRKMIAHVLLSLLAPFWYCGGKYTTKTLFDGVTAAFLAAGIIYSLMRPRGVRLFILVCFVLSAGIIGATTPQANIRGSRMLILIPIVCVLAGIGADRLLALLRRLCLGRKGVYIPAAAAVMIVMAALNLHRLYVVLPAVKGVQPFALAIQYFREAPAAPRNYYVLARGFDFWAAYDIEAYGLAEIVTVYGLEDLLSGAPRIVPPCRVVLCNLGGAEVRGVMDLLDERFHASEPETIREAGGGWGSLEIVTVAGRK